MSTLEYPVSTVAGAGHTSWVKGLELVDVNTFMTCACVRVRVRACARARPPCVCACVLVQAFCVRARECVRVRIYTHYGTAAAEQTRSRSPACTRREDAGP